MKQIPFFLPKTMLSLVDAVNVALELGGTQVRFLPRSSFFCEGLIEFPHVFVHMDVGINPDRTLEEIGYAGKVTLVGPYVARRAGLIQGVRTDLLSSCLLPQLLERMFGIRVCS